jgi:exodeoxyribonuclease-3
MLQAPRSASAAVAPAHAPAASESALLRILSWNVNGLRSVEREGAFSRWLDDSGAFFVGVQEVRARSEQLPPRLTALPGWHTGVVAAERKGYSGVGYFSRRQPDAVETALDGVEFDREGRLQLVRFGNLVLANVYFPNGNGVQRDNSRVPFKLAFYRALYARLSEERRAGRAVLVVGDFNTAHREIDLARPRQNLTTSGFLPEERAELDRWLDGGWIDTFRQFEPGPGHYSWWSQRSGARQRNVGWRIDYVLACPRASQFLRSAFILREVCGSDHCPVGVTLDPAVLR